MKQILDNEWVFYVSRKFNFFVEYTQVLANTPSAQKGRSPERENGRGDQEGRGKTCSRIEKRRKSSLC